MAGIVSKPWSVADFEVNRPHLTKFVHTSVLPLLEDSECRRIVIRAPVKSGKREMVEYTAMRDFTTTPHRYHVFISAWHRRAEDEQRDELSKHNMRVFSIINTARVAECLKWMTDLISKGKRIVVHLDECDHGSGKKQMLSKVWSYLRATVQITTILYSATPQEVLFSSEVEDEEYNSMIDEIKEGYLVRYNPPIGYCGPNRFLDEGLVVDATPFFYNEPTGFVLSEQAKDIIKKLLLNIRENPDRNIVLLRLSYSEIGGKASDRMKNKAIYQFLNNIESFPDLASFDIIVDKGDDSGIKSQRFGVEKIKWSDPGHWSRSHPVGRPRLIIIDQTCSRSTELACHNRIFATHDFRNVVQFSTISQAQERVNHYEQRYGGFQSILVYGHKKTFLLSADKIDYSVYLSNMWCKRKVDKVDKRKVDKNTTNGDVYSIKSIPVRAGPSIIHPEFPDPLSSLAADKVLQELGCYANVSVSVRVAGRIVDKPVFTSKWRPATMETWQDTLTTWQQDPENTAPVADGRRTVVENPFIKAAPHRLPNGDWQGYHRGWSRLDYDTDIVGDEGWGVIETGSRRKICYKNGVLGVAICWRKGVERVNSLSAVNSMYHTD